MMLEAVFAVFKLEWLLALLVIFLVYKIATWFSSPLRLIPGPKGSIILGNTSQIAYPNDTHQVLLRWEKEYGEIFRTWTIFSGYSVHLSNPDHIKQVLVADAWKYHRSNTLRIIMGEHKNETNLFNSNGKIHAMQRKMLNPAFSLSSVKSFIPVFNSKTNELIKYWNNLAGTELSSYNENIQEKFTNLTLDIIGESAFGFQFNSINGQHSKESKATDKILRGKFDLKGRAMEILFPFLKVFPSKARKEVEDAFQCFNSLLQRVINIRRRELSQPDPPERKDLLQIMFSLKDENGNRLDDEDLLGQVRLFMVAGHETTSMAMTWTILLLSKYPQFQDRVRNEIKQFLEKEDDITFEKLNNMKFLDNCIKESMRLYPPAISVNRTLVKDTKIGPYEIPKGTTIVIRMNSAHRDGRYWKDPETFNPDRYDQQESGENASLFPYRFLPFSRGPRMCIGYRFAETELKCVLAKILRNFHFKLAEGQPVEFRCAVRLTLRPDPPTLVAISKVD